MYGPSDMYGDLDLEDVDMEDADEFESLGPEDGREVSPGGMFERDEFRHLDPDFEDEWDDAEDDEYGYDSDDDAMEEEDWQDREDFIEDEASLEDAE